MSVLETISRCAVANGQKEFPIKTYKCPDCGEWHLTSQATSKEMEAVIKYVQMKVETDKIEKRLSAKSTRKKVWIKKLKM